MGWGWRNLFSISNLSYRVTHPDIIFTPGAAHSTRTKVNNSGDQISTNFDHKVAQLLIQTSNSSGYTGANGAASTATPTLTPMTDPALQSQHMDTGAHVQIPAIKIDAPLETVGLNTNGRMDVPSLHGENGVGWLENGPRPGDIGSAAIDGYASQPDGSQAVFANLAALHTGDTILIVYPNGVVQHFHVLTVQNYPANQVPPATIFNDTSGSYLNLLTCDNNWIPSLSQSQSQVIVHAILN
ncbi:hypothetical protein KDK_24130 [Dictyobacter kobayashii]|uniref:Class F sortase n=1 Tax=Dictyobacter kobayashii TaxID=2014872 RepID=A0A402AHT0_9CHLR|nr:hypothetical protein KDK_24130 [Dictyobacter kobayashii]